MHNSTSDFEKPRAPRPLGPSDLPTGVPLTRTEAGQRESIRLEGMKIAQTAVQSIGIDTRDPWGAPKPLPDYALAVSLLFTKATNQTIILGTPPKHVLSTSILWSSLAHDKRFEQVPMNEAAPGDIVIGSGWQQGADGFAGIVVDHGRIVSNSSQGVQDNSNLSEIQRSHPGMIAFRYVGFWNYYRSKPLANAGFNPDEARLPAGQPGGGQWTAGMAPSKTVLSGGNPRTTAQEALAAQKANPEAGKATKEREAEASKLSKLAQTYLEKAKEEDQAAALALATSGMGDEYQRHKAAAGSARSIAAELQRRAYILDNGTEGNYRQLMFQKYGINNPELNEIAAYFAEKFHDQATLNWLKLQHPADRPKLDVNSLAMMTLLPEGEAADEGLQGEKPPEKSVFEQTTDLEKATANSDSVASSRDKLKPENTSPAKFGNSSSNNYRATFFAEHPDLEGKVVVHHAVPQKALILYPNEVSEAQIHSLENLRGIPKGSNPQVHASEIAKEWNQFYKGNPNATQAQLLQKATDIDRKYGSKFNPPIGETRK